MDRKKESRKDLGTRQTGGNCTSKDKKRKRLKIPELVSKWTQPVDVLSLKRGAM